MTTSIPRELGFGGILHTFEVLVSASTIEELMQKPEKST
jgi:hypothetical protein